MFSDVKTTDGTKHLSEDQAKVIGKSPLFTSDFVSSSNGHTWHPFSTGPSHRFYVLSKPPNSNMTWHVDKAPGSEEDNKWGTVVYVILGPDEMSSIVHSFASTASEEDPTEFLKDLDRHTIQIQPTDFTNYVKYNTSSKPSNLLAVYNNGTPHPVDDSQFQTQLRSADRPLKVQLTLPDELVSAIDCPGLNSFGYVVPKEGLEDALTEKRNFLHRAGLRHIAVVGERGSVLAFDGAALHGVENVAKTLRVTITPTTDTVLCAGVNVPTLRDIELAESDLQSFLTVDGKTASEVSLRYEWSSKARGLSLAVWVPRTKRYVSVQQTLPLKRAPLSKDDVVKFVATATFARPQIVLAVNLPRRGASSS